MSKIIFYFILYSIVLFFTKINYFGFLVLKYAISDLIGALCIYLSFFKKLYFLLKIVKIQISWLLKKLADQDPHYFP